MRRGRPSSRGEENEKAGTYETEERRPVPSSMDSLPLAVDPEGMRVALSTNGQMPIRIVGIFDEQEWLRLHRPAEETSDIPGVVEASFSGNPFLLRYWNRRGETLAEKVDLPDRPVEASQAHE